MSTIEFFTNAEELKKLTSAARATITAPFFGNNVEHVSSVSEAYKLAKDSSGSNVGTGGMATKLIAAKIATFSGADMVIANGRDVGVIHDIFEGEAVGTTFHANPNPNFHLETFIMESIG